MLSLPARQCYSPPVPNHTIRIDPEIQALIPPLTADELAQLEANLLDEGCRDRLVVWSANGTLLDGHHRHALCQQHGIPSSGSGPPQSSLAPVETA
jgi:hypothetical protein